ncbi:hypothetical protein NQ314_012099 [Rhamnusium bicolor]|uniref:Uncharacterized protein n=1 Tax=Rhamnusium bicolor TaxID=1586634 RepID=A0AAV8XEF5_9CUCU|nr:hypothetical protein NQ314_012099 [Rhamnusium bicolor]
MQTVMSTQRSSLLTFTYKTVNCERAEVIGQASLTKFIGKSFNKAQFLRKDKVKNIAAITKTIKIGNQEVNINSNQLFHRIVCVVKTDEELKPCLKYQLAPQLTSLFDTISLRKGKKSSLIDILERCCPSTEELPVEPSFVIDGGDLLHRVIWPKPGSFLQICHSYIDYVKRNYGTKCTIVFDGYTEGEHSTKDAEHFRRSGRPKKSVDVAVSAAIFPSVTQSEFLSNVSNKRNFISLLSEHLEAANFKIQIAPGDADIYIVNAAIKLSVQGQKGGGYSRRRGGLCQAELPTEIPHLDELEIVKERCDKKGGAGTYDKIKKAEQETQTCIKGIINIETVKNEVEEAKKKLDRWMKFLENIVVNDLK